MELRAQEAQRLSKQAPVGVPVHTLTFSPSPCDHGGSRPQGPRNPWHRMKTSRRVAKYWPRFRRHANQKECDPSSRTGNRHAQRAEDSRKWRGGGRWWPAVVVSTDKCQSSAYCLVSNDNCHSFRQLLPFTTGFTVTSIPRSSVGPVQVPWGPTASLAHLYGNFGQANIYI